jgi:hypothetical protein
MGTSKTQFRAWWGEARAYAKKTGRSVDEFARVSGNFNGPMWLALADCEGRVNGEDPSYRTPNGRHVWLGGDW